MPTCPYIVVKSGTYEIFSVREDGHEKWLPAGSDSPSVSLFDNGDDARYATRHHGANLIVREVPPSTKGTWYVRTRGAAMPLLATAVPG